MSLSLDFQIEYSTDKREGNLCFTHAVQRAIKGEFVTTEVDDYDKFISHTSCVDCADKEI